MVIVDTSIWIDHFRRGRSSLVTLLDDSMAFIHPFVVGELACGNLANRKEIIGLLRKVPQAPRATDEELLHFIEARDLMGRGVGLVDMHLLASTKLLDDSVLWTRDKRLHDLATELAVAFQATH